MRRGRHRAATDGEVYTRERLHILEIVTAAEDPAMSIARARVEVGVTTARHLLVGVDERYLLVAGRGEMDVGDRGDWLAVRPGDVVAIPAGTAQRIRNTGNEDLVFFCLCTPPYRESCYRDLEEGRAAAERSAKGRPGAAGSR